MPVKLTNGTRESEGTVEIYLDGIWGTICDISWQHSHANIVCQQLGYPGMLQIIPYAKNVFVQKYTGMHSIPAYGILSIYSVVEVEEL